MNKLIYSIIKSVKILLRSKSSAMIVLLGPILIVLIIGAGFYDSTQAALNIGVYSQSNTNLTNRFIKSLQTPENNIIMYTSEDACVKSIQQGFTVTCISFPDNFFLEDNKSNEVKFFVDESRINLVYKIISSLSLNLDSESGQISQELTSRLLEIMVSSSKRVDETLNNLKDLGLVMDSSKQTVSDMKSSINSLDANDVSVSFENVSSNLENLNNTIMDLRKDAKDTIESGYNLLNVISYNGSAVQDLKHDLSNLDDLLDESDNSTLDVERLKNTLVSFQNTITILREKLKDTRSTKTVVLKNIDSFSNNLDKLSTGLLLIADKQTTIQKDIDSFKLRDAKNIVNPITTKIEPVSTIGNKIIFTFPYLLMLIVMFVGMMLSGTLIFIENDSKAFFRNFIAPVEEIFFSITTFLTSFFVLFVQIIIILLLAIFTLHVLFSNIGITTITIFLSMTIFILIGMLLGYLFNTSEAIMMSALALGSVMIFFSNLILPLETLAPTIQLIASFNPYVIASEMIRKAMLFGASFDTLYSNIITLFVYGIIVLILIFLVKNIKLKKHYPLRYFKKEKDVLLVFEEKKIDINNKQLVIKDVYSLLDALRALSNDEYIQLKKEDVFGSWIEKNLKNKILANSIRRKTRKKAIERTLKYLNK